MPRQRGTARLALLVVLLLLGACGGGGDGSGIENQFVKLIVAGFDRSRVVLVQGGTLDVTVEMRCDATAMLSFVSPSGPQYRDIRAVVRPESRLGEGVSARLTGERSADDGQSGWFACETPSDDPDVLTGRITVRLSADVDAALEPGTLVIYLELLSFCSLDDCGRPSDSTRADLAFSVVPSSTGVNLLANPGFEQAVDNGPLPNAAGSWRGDLSASVPADNDITPHGGAAMLKFLATGNAGSATLVSSQQWQIVDLSAYTAQLLSGRMQADASVWFHRIAGNASTDRRFDLRVLAFAGSPVELPARYAAADWLAERTTTVNTGGEAWQQALASLRLPPTTGYLLFEIYAFEDVTNDASEEFAGHYADDAALVLTELAP
jgi:hypothetical protein